ncbi:lasso peptide biosynthesis B2 protein [Actinorugispora endophytica]|uniref:Transglutaminase superfamily protein n=1 Tax=Actinorugispora endophytica TaxID=1605990 RepID=A0A4R6UF57_9ACTN|nr:lasso peptide biosynthesis B2 protein [Actinorugispora endophytica]TDQ45391.1 transglutaminase superfamily protein [Actinorugispora endophytica]
MTGYISAPDHIVACDLGPATVIVDYRTGRVRSLTGAAATWWTDMARSGEQTSSTALPKAAAKTLTERLLTAGLLHEADGPSPWNPPVPGHPWRPSWGTQELGYGFSDLPDVPPGRLALALLALAATLAVRSCGPRRRAMARLVRLVRHARAGTPATPEEAETVVHAVRRAGLCLPARVACLEESVAAALTLAMLGCAVVWCHGVAGDPIELHAWLETSAGNPIAEPPSTGRFRALLAIRTEKETDPS